MGELASITTRTCASMFWRGRTLEARCLTAAEVTDWYLPLRYDVLSRELGWTVGDVRSPADMRDAYDRQSVAFGVVITKVHLIGALRLILSFGENNLPSVRLLRSLGRHPRIAFPAAEISRMMVRRNCRKLGVAPVLLLSALLLAKRAQVRTLLISERDNARFGRMMGIHGFERLADGFSFVDDMIAPDEPAVTYALDMDRCGREAQQAVTTKRETMLRAADGVFTAALTGPDGQLGYGGEQQRLSGVVIMPSVLDVLEASVEH
jgi:N-acyl-L-homoserine lactone synthetase